MRKLDAEYWNQQYKNQNDGWDIGYASPAIMEYFQQVKDKTVKILIPGAGFAWEAEALWELGFEQVSVLDYSAEALKSFKSRVPDFPKSHIFEEDFFQHQGSYDYIVEQTFFSSLPLALRQDYAKQVAALLKNNGQLIGLLFNHQFEQQAPPFGALPSEYEELLSPYFYFRHFDIAYNSIKPRINRELFVLLQKKENT